MLYAEWHWRDDAYTTKPWQATRRHNGATLERRNFKYEHDAREYAKAWTSHAERSTDSKTGSNDEQADL